MIEFEKWNGAGNDFIIFQDLDDSLKLTPELVKILCDRHFGIGADGVIRAIPGNDDCAVFMDYWNSDGSVAEMCGNGIRCLAAFCVEKKIIIKSKFKIDTRSGAKDIEMLSENRIKVDMGYPIFNPKEIPFNTDNANALNISLKIGENSIDLSAVSMGNPHAVVFTEEPQSMVKTFGALIEKNVLFPKKTNVEFVKVLSKNSVQMCIWERGAGETSACGTGACAAAVLSHLLKGTDSRIYVIAPGGELEIEWNGSLNNNQSVFMTGPVCKNFEGKFYTT